MKAFPERRWTSQRSSRVAHATRAGGCLVLLLQLSRAEFTCPQGSGSCPDNNLQVCRDRSWWLLRSPPRVVVHSWQCKDSGKTTSWYSPVHGLLLSVLDNVLSAARCQMSDGASPQPSPQLVVAFVASNHNLVQPQGCRCAPNA